MDFTPSIKNLIRIISLTLAVFFGSVGKVGVLISIRELLLSKVEISQLLYVNGHLLPNREMPMLSLVWV